MKTTLLSLLLLLFCNSIIVSQSHSNQLKKPTKQYKSIHLELIDNRYDSLSVIAINYKAKNNEYKGKSKDGRNWYFKIPESVFNKTKGLAFRNFPTYDKEAIKMLNLYFIERSDTFMSPNYINFNKTKNINIKLKYVKRDSIQSYHKNLAGEIKLTKYIDDFYVMKEPDIENILSVRENANFCWFNINRNPNKTYKEFLTGYVELIKQYPNSKTLLTMLLDEFEGGKFRSKEDIQLLFNSFSKQNKNSYFGHILKEKLSVATTSSKFQNFRLPNSVSHKLEPIITDSAKYNLIIFSASWCSPCHKLIPLLKNIHNELSQKLNLIYISLDEQSTLKQWEKLIKTENINWRCLSAFNNLEFVKNRFLAYSIPKSWIVSPDGKMQIIDLRDSKEVENLYSLVK